MNFRRVLFLTLIAALAGCASYAPSRGAHLRAGTYRPVALHETPPAPYGHGSVGRAAPIGNLAFQTQFENWVTVDRVPLIVTRMWVNGDPIEPWRLIRRARYIGPGESVFATVPPCPVIAGANCRYLAVAEVSSFAIDPRGRVLPGPSMGCVERSFVAGREHHVVFEDTNRRPCPVP